MAAWIQDLLHGDIADRIVGVGDPVADSVRNAGQTVGRTIGVGRKRPVGLRQLDQLSRGIVSVGGYLAAGTAPGTLPRGSVAVTVCPAVL